MGKLYRGFFCSNFSPVPFYTENFTAETEAEVQEYFREVSSRLTTERGTRIRHYYVCITDEQAKPMPVQRTKTRRNTKRRTAQRRR